MPRRVVDVDVPAERVAELREQLLARVRLDLIDSPLYAAQFASWSLGVVLDRVYRFGQTIADHGERVLVEPGDGPTRCIYAPHFGADVTVRAEKVRVLS